MTATAPQDSRFDTSAWSTQEAEAGPSKTAHSSASDEGSEAEEDEEQDDDEDELNNDDAEGNTSPLPSSLIPTLTPKELEAFERKQRKRGIIYISRIPPGMTPPKVRHLLSGFGEVERIYLQDGRRKEREREQGSTGVGMGGKRKKTRRFTEGWIEFTSKSTAKIVASSLNAQPIGFSSGGRKSNKNARRWQDDVWTMKYLPGFKWHMLSEQMAHERAAHASRLRTELSQSKVEQQDYLKKVERNRVQKLKEEKRRAREGGEGKKGSAEGAAPGKQQSDEQQQRVRTFKQRKPILRDVREQEAAASGSGSGSGGGDKKRKRSGDNDGGERSSRPRGGNDGSGGLSGVLSKIL